MNLAERRVEEMTCREEGTVFRPFFGDYRLFRLHQKPLGTGIASAGHDIDE